MSNEQFGPAINTSAYSGDEVRPVGGLGIAAAALIGLALVGSAIDVWSDWHRANLIDDLVYGGRQISFDELTSADSTAMATSWLSIGTLILAGVMVMVWLARARRNAEDICVAEHRRARGWVFWGWIVPIVSLWFPYMFVEDVYKASRPDNPHDLVSLSTVRGSGLLGVWWGFWVARLVTSWILIVSLRGEETVEMFHRAAVINTVSLVVSVAAAVAFIMIIRRISGWQDQKVSNAR